MADIRLQNYVAKIKDLIRSVRLDEAIAHCQHILHHYPKHIETYGLLGEACLEKQMYREAIEFFQRTLGADPENLMARVGLGVIYDEQGAFPEAIWQLERAFELVPGNSEVHRELLRLYGQYDGIDKSRLKLTRGALGRLYSRNGLYERAIGEFHAVLRQDPELPDIRVALVEALWREGRQLEAVEMCMELLDALPNCLKANLILGEIWTRSGREEGQMYLRRAEALDPENQMVQELFEAASPLPAREVRIVPLEYRPSSEAARPAWMADMEAVSVEGPSARTSPALTTSPSATIGFWLIDVPWFERSNLRSRSVCFLFAPFSLTTISSLVTVTISPSTGETMTSPESTADRPSIPVPTSGASVVTSGTAWRCMFEPIRARFASSCSRNGIRAAATDTFWRGLTSM
jgi:tetratricopeptide (TPR) repeat protein